MRSNIEDSVGSRMAAATPLYQRLGSQGMAYHLLTGATGLLGRYLLKDLLLADVPVAVLVRPTRRANVRQRVESLMCYWDELLGRPLPRPVILEGDICEPGLGLDEKSTQWVAAHCDTFLHNAASLTFVSTGPDSEPWRSNVAGTKHVLDFCQATGITKFHHVSTAYTCGLREGRILETELDVGQSPGNDYEASKIQAETMVHGADFLTSRTIFRPSIIVGDSVTGLTTTFHGFYAPLQLVWMVAKSKDKDFTGLLPAYSRLALHGNEGKNFVPVEWVSAATAHIVTNPELHGKTYHLTPPHRVPSRLTRDVLEQSTGSYGSTFLGANEVLENLDENEQLFYDHMQVYNSYWRDDPIFDRTNIQAACPHLPCPHVDRDVLMRLANWAIDTEFGGGRQKPIEPEFDTHSHLEGLLQTSLPDRPQAPLGRLLGLQVDGHGGGQWHLMWREGKVVGADVGLADSCSAVYRLNVDTFASLASGEVTAAHAVAVGDVVILGNGLSKPELTGVLQQVVLKVGC
jgi:thioester reductase-like protein